LYVHIYTYSYVQLRQSYAILSTIILWIFTFHYKNVKNCNISATIRQVSTKFNLMMQNISQKCIAVENLNFSIPRWQTVAILKTKNCNILWWCRIGLSSASAVHHLGLLKLNSLRAMHLTDMFCIIVPIFHILQQFTTWSH